MYTTIHSNNGKGIESGLKKIEEEDKEDDQVDIFNIIQKSQKPVFM